MPLQTGNKPDVKYFTTQMEIINYSSAFKALDIHVKQHNSTKVHLSEQIRQATASTAKNIIRIYGLSLLKATNLQKIDPQNPPSLKTNNVQLAKMGNASPRTIQRHIKRLIDCNIITEKIWHGSNSGYELLVNPNILLIGGVKAVNTPKNDFNSKELESSKNQSIKNNNTTTCPHTDTSNNSYINNIIIDVDKWKTEMSSLPLTKFKKSRNANSNALTGYTGEKCPKINESAGGNAREKRVTIQTGVEKPSENLTRPASLKNYVDKLWNFAQNTLYKERYLTESQQKIAQELLFQWYEPVSTSKLENAHQVYVERIILVQKYIEKDPINRFVQLPNTYFDPKNKTGFAGTRSWYVKQKERKAHNQLKLILHAQTKLFLNNEKKETSKQKPRLALFTKCETRLGKLGNPALVKAFHASVLKHSTYNFLY